MSDEVQREWPEPGSLDPAAAQRAWGRVEQHGGLVGTPEIAERFGVAKGRARGMVRRPSFPDPVLHVAGVDLWLLADVDAWRALRGKTGRPTLASLGEA